MINLRFHIVSITAVFLALAIGIFMGTSLLQRATVDSLKAGQRSLETKIDQSQRENTAYRDALGVADAAASDFGDDALGDLVADRLHGAILVVASRGIDEDALSAVRSTLEDAGATVVGTVWTDDRSALDDESVREAVSTATGTPLGDAAAMRKRVVDAVAGALGPILATQPDPTTTTTTTAPDGEPPGDDPAAVLAGLDQTGALAWEPTDGATFPASGLRVLVVSGEGATTPAAKVLYPLIRALDRDHVGAVLAGEVMDQRTSLAEVDRVLAGQDPPRGAFVGPIRGDALREDVTTIDDLDSPYGRLAAVLALARPVGSAIGAYGITAAADSQYPPRTP
jgi:hypothetical protein